MTTIAPTGRPEKAGTVAKLEDNDVVIVEAVRSPLGRRNGGLATLTGANFGS